MVCGNLQWVLELEKIGHLRLRGVVLCEILKYLRCFGDPVSAVDQLLAVLQQQLRAVVGIILRQAVYQLLTAFFHIHQRTSLSLGLAGRSPGTGFAANCPLMEGFFTDCSGCSRAASISFRASPTNPSRTAEWLLIA